MLILAGPFIQLTYYLGKKKKTDKIEPVESYFCIIDAFKSI